MTAVSTIAPGAFCWAELGTTDQAGAKQFYTKLFGWSYVDSPMGGGEMYTMFQIDGKKVCAAYQQSPNQTAPGTPPSWRAYISVSDTDALANKIPSLGGTVIMPPFDVMDVGRMTMLQDPTGAVVALWQPKRHHGMDVSGQVNTVCWYELLTKDLPRARSFYSSLLGWTTEEQPMGPMTYTLIKNRGQQIGGMIEIQPEWGKVPPHWMLYFAVADCDRTAETTRALGGVVHSPPTDISGVGRFAVLQDPQGATFSVIRMNMS